MPYIKQAWRLIRWAWFLVLLLWPLALAAWVFHLALGLRTGPMDDWTGFLGFASVLVLFRGFWRHGIAFFGQVAPMLWRFTTSLSADLHRLARYKLKAASYRIRTDWADLRRTLKSKTRNIRIPVQTRQHFRSKAVTRAGESIARGNSSGGLAGQPPGDRSSAFAAIGTAQGNVSDARRC